ncbi:MAG: DNA polymerase I [Planctomycetes bacterium]|nr:DNA polymerase I [Planctomycetota bacterium]
MPAETLVVIDGHYYAYKFFFGMPPLTGPGGRPTGVTYAFANMARDLRQNPLLTHLVCVFDIGDSFRNQIFAEYKAHRDPMPDLLAAQLDDVEEILRASGVPIIKALGFEADDVLATLAKQASAAGMNVRLCTKDKDIDQLLNERVRTWDPGKDILRGPKELQEEKGITPAQVIDYLCMIGDSADNVPGITGVGPKNAAKLLVQYGNLAAVLANSDQLKGKQKENVEAFKPQAELTCRLIQLADVPDLPPLDTFRIDRSLTGDEAAFTKFGFSRARFFPTQAQPASTADAPYRILALTDLPGFIADLRTAGRFAFDTETTGLDPLTADLVGISFACGIPDARAAAYLPIRGLDHALVPWDAAKALLAPLFADATVKKVGQNTKYDVRVLARHGITVNGVDGDTMLASWLLDPGRESHGIDHLTKSFLNEAKIATGQVIDFANGQTMAQVPVATVAKYACEDAQCCWRLAQVLEAKLAENNLLEVYRTQEVPIAGCLGRMEDAGLLVNRDTLSATQRHLEQYLTEVTASIRKHAGGSFNPASPKQVADLLFTKLGLPVMSQTKSGPSTDASVLEALRHLHELPDLLLQHRMLSKLIGTYLTKLPEYISADGRIHTNLKQTGAETGRLASDSPNLQNIPKKSDLGREIRAAFIPGPDRLFLAADYSQIELRVLAHLSGDPTLKQAFASGADIHRFVAAQVAGIDEASVTPKQRNAAKAVNFGIIYGQTAFGLSQQLGIARGEAQKFIDGYFARFSQVKAYIASVIEQAVSRGYAETIAGRRRYVPHLSSGNRNERLQGERIALNSTIQGSAADLIKCAMLRCDTMLPAGSRLVLQIHDELLVEADATVADAAAAALREAMTGAWILNDVALIAEVRRGDTWFAVS